MPRWARISSQFERAHRRSMAGFSRCDGPRSRGAPKRKLGQRRCGTRTTASSNRCVGPWGHAAAQGGFRAARSPVTASHQSRAPGHVSGPVAARSRPPRRPRSQIFPQSAQSASKLQCPPHDSLENAVFQKRFGFVWQIPYWNGFGIPRNEFRAAHIAAGKSCAGAFGSSACRYHLTEHAYGPVTLRTPHDMDGGGAWQRFAGARLRCLR